jgi:large subunit ribosomal protein L30
MPGKLRVTQTKSTISHIARNRATIRALGLHGIGSSSVLPDNEAVRGMVRQVRFLVTFEELERQRGVKLRLVVPGQAAAARRQEAVDAR